MPQGYKQIITRRNVWISEICTKGLPKGQINNGKQIASILAGGITTFSRKTKVQKFSKSASDHNNHCTSCRMCVCAVDHTLLSKSCTATGREWQSQRAKERGCLCPKIRTRPKAKILQLVIHEVALVVTSPLDTCRVDHYAVSQRDWLLRILSVKPTGNYRMLVQEAVYP